jgi:hypothetical protein
MSSAETGTRLDGADLGLERAGALQRAVRRLLFNPLANYAPAGMSRALLRWSKSELAQSNWKDPGGWRSMVISYDGRCRQIADRILVATGTMPMALRNRRRLAAHLIAGLIDAAPEEPVHLLCLGAGPGLIALDALERARRRAFATLVDLNADAFDYGLELARARGLAERVRYIQADVRDLGRYLDRPPHVVKMIGICEYLADEQITAIASAAGGLMPPGAAMVFNSLSPAHGTDRFFRRVFGLHMIHRSPRQLQDLMATAGLGDFQVQAEPLGVYHVVVARKVTPASR